MGTRIPDAVYIDVFQIQAGPKVLIVIVIVLTSNMQSSIMASAFKYRFSRLHQFTKTSKHKDSDKLVIFFFFWMNGFIFLKTMLLHRNRGESSLCCDNACSNTNSHVTDTLVTINHTPWEKSVLQHPIPIGPESHLVGSNGWDLQNLGYLATPLV